MTLEAAMHIIRFIIESAILCLLFLYSNFVCTLDYDLKAFITGDWVAIPKITQGCNFIWLCVYLVTELLSGDDSLCYFVDDDAGKKSTKKDKKKIKKVEKEKEKTEKESTTKKPSKMVWFLSCCRICSKSLCKTLVLNSLLHFKYFKIIVTVFLLFDWKSHVHCFVCFAKSLYVVCF